MSRINYFQSILSTRCSQGDLLHLGGQPLSDKPTQPNPLQSLSLSALSGNRYETRKGEQISEQEEGEGGNVGPEQAIGHQTNTTSKGEQ